MRKTITKAGICCSLLLSLAGAATAQTADSTFKPSGKLWGYAFGDLAYKGSGDNPINRGGSNQYTNIPVNTNLFQWRRIYLGYDYNISAKFSAEFLLAAEDDFAAGVLGQKANSTSAPVTGSGGTLSLGNNGDVLVNNKFSPYVKLANIRWKNIYKNADLIIGQSATPTFAKNGSGMASEEVWGYRSIERTITDIRRTTSYDFGACVQGKFDSKGNFGYTVMVANGQGDKPENDIFKSFYGDVWAKFANKKIIVDLYQDYTKQNWGVYVPGAKAGTASLNGARYNDRNMTKLFAAYTVPKLTVGAEVFMNTLMGDVAVAGKDGSNYYRTTQAMGVSVFVKGRITAEKFGFFARFDNYDPTMNLKNIANEANTKTYTAGTSQYEPTTKEMFATFGIDYTPIKNVHIMPNVWLNTYSSGLDQNGANSATTKYTSMNGNVTGAKGTDAVYRLTFYYVYGK